MPVPEYEQPERAVLAEAIGHKISKMDLDGMVDLAVKLKVKVPQKILSLRNRDRLSKAVKAKMAPVQAVRDDRNVLRGAGLGGLVSVEAGERMIDKIAVDDESSDWIESEFLGTVELAKKLDVSRGSIDNWRNEKKIVALKKGFRNFIYPLRQFVGRTPVDGLDVIAQSFESPEDTWEWLVAHNRMTGDKPPIEALRAGDVELVQKAALSALDYV